jgi:hypothetical protein
MPTTSGIQRISYHSDPPRWNFHINSIGGASEYSATKRDPEGTEAPRPGQVKFTYLTQLPSVLMGILGRPTNVHPVADHYPARCDFEEEHSNIYLPLQTNKQRNTFKVWQPRRAARSERPNTPSDGTKTMAL